ncbi:MAG: FHA domain-containing protein [Pseudonocardia sp.]
MTTCSAGHDSATADYCDTCGTPLDPTLPAPTSHSRPLASNAQTCGYCGAVRDGRFCEECGRDAAIPPDTSQPIPGDTPPPPLDTSQRGPLDNPQRDPTSPPSPFPPEPPVTRTWTAIVAADRAWFEEVGRRDGPDAPGLEFPRYCPERRFVLAGSQMAIGRRSRSRGTEPEIDLAGPPLDPGVSAHHALLLAQPDGHWQLVDVGSTNGTSLGDAPEPIAPHTPVILADGDRIKIGAWTTITITCSTSR